MKYNLKTESKKAIEYLNKLIKNESMIELKKVSLLRTNQQNRYLHKAISLFAIETGYTNSESKQVIKRAIGYVYEKDGIIFYRETSKMDTKEMTIFIDKFRKYCSDFGFYIPSPDEYNFNFDKYENIIYNNREYL